MTTNINENKQLKDNDDEDEIHTLKEAMKRPDLGIIIVDKERYQFSREYTSRDFKCIKESEITFCNSQAPLQLKFHSQLNQIVVIIFICNLYSACVLSFSIIYNGNCHEGKLHTVHIFPSHSCILAIKYLYGGSRLFCYVDALYNA